MNGLSRGLRRGFTLLEVLISIALTIALLGAMFSFFWDILATRQRIIERTAQGRAADVMIDHLERDLLTALVGDGVVGAGIEGGDAEITILSRGVPARLAESDGALGFADLERATFRFDAATHSIAARREVVRMRQRPPRGAFAELGGTVHRVRFRYYDGATWLDAFDSRQAEALPVAIEVAIWFDPTPAEARAAAESVEFSDDLDESFVPADRFTFDAGAGFDDRAFALESDLESDAEPVPDRVRVIVLADARVEEPPVGDASAAGAVNESLE